MTEIHRVRGTIWRSLLLLILHMLLPMSDRQISQGELAGNPHSQLRCLHTHKEMKTLWLWLPCYQLARATVSMTTHPGLI